MKIIICEDQATLREEIRRILSKLFFEEEDVAIVFLTAHGEFVFLGYEVHAYDFILKPVSERKLRKVVQRFLEERQYRYKKNTFWLRKKAGKRKFLWNMCNILLVIRGRLQQFLRNRMSLLSFI